MSPQSGLDRHQLAGLDDRERGFSRPVDFEQVGEGYRAVLRYEATRVTSATQQTPHVAFLSLIQALQALGYRQLKSQASFRNGVYLGSQEPWVEHPDPLQPDVRPSGFIATLLKWFRSRATNT
jgi:hypothetical protein